MCQNLGMGIYPSKLSEVVSHLLDHGRCSAESASGVSADFECGTAMRISLAIDPEAKTILDIAFTSNACGYGIAAAQVLSDEIRGSRLTDLHGSSDLDRLIARVIGNIPADRSHCVDLAINCLLSALANYRTKILDEFQGEKALICTCFGVSEEAVLRIIENDPDVDVNRVSAACNAGVGCGSCQVLIQDLIDNHRNERAGDIVL